MSTLMFTDHLSITNHTNNLRHLCNDDEPLLNLCQQKVGVVCLEWVGKWMENPR